MATGNDVIVAGPGVDTADGDGDEDSMFGNDGADDLFDGDAGDDVVFGMLGDDNIRGGDDDDNLIGNEGDDDIEGGNAKDVDPGRHRRRSTAAPMPGTSLRRPILDKPLVYADRRPTAAPATPTCPVTAMPT